MEPQHGQWLNLIFVLAAFLFLALEKFFPDRKLNYHDELKLDLAAFGVLLLSGALISDPLIRLYRSLQTHGLVLLPDAPLVVRVLLATLLTDFLNYWVHYFMHRSDLYWRTHLFHHQVQNLYWFSGLRSSLGHYASFILTRVTVGVLLFQLSSLELLVYFSVGIITNFYQHTNSRLNHPWIELILVTPRIHRMHHATFGRRMKNLGTIFSFWDRLFGTYVDPRLSPENFQIGVERRENESELIKIIGF